MIRQRHHRSPNDSDALPLAAATHSQHNNTAAKIFTFQSTKKTVSSRNKLLLVLLLVVLLILVSPLPARLMVHSSDSYAQHWQDLEAIQKIALPPGNSLHITAVIMNHNRPRMLRESNLMSTLLAHDAIRQVLLCHSNPATAFDWQHDKVTNINATAANQEMGLALRFWYAATAAVNDLVLLVDDDMELAPAAIDGLLRGLLWQQQQMDKHQPNHVIIGHYGRGYHYWTALLRNGYHTRTLYGHVPVVLTKLMLLPRTLCAAFFDYEAVVWNDLVRPYSRPLWNGEDIFVNCVANHLGNVPASSGGPYRNLALANLPVWEASSALDDEDTTKGAVHDVSGNMERHSIWKVGVWNWWQSLCKAQAHAAFRGRLWAAAVERLAKLGPNQTAPFAQRQAKLRALLAAASSRGSDELGSN